MSDVGVETLELRAMRRISTMLRDEAEHLSGPEMSRVSTWLNALCHEVTGEAYSRQAEESGNKRLTKLEAALQRIADAPPYSLGDIINIARKALEEGDDGV